MTRDVLPHPEAWVLGLLVPVLYWPALAGQPLDWDDPVWLGDPLLSMPLGPALIEAFTTALDHVYYPLTRMAWWVDRALFDGFEASHGVHVALFALAVVGVADLFHRLGMSRPASAIATAIWAAHPTRVESVAWLTGRKDVLSLVLVVLAMRLVWVHRRDRWGSAALIAAVLAKSSVFPMAGILALGIAWQEGWGVAAWRAALRRTGPALVGSAVLAVGGAVLFRGSGVAYPHGEVVADGLFAIGLQGQWVSRVLWPVDLAAIQPIPPSSTGYALLGVGTLGVAAGLAWGLRSAMGGALVVAWLGLLLPFHGVVPMAFWASDRHLLLPMLALVAAVGVGIDRAGRTGLAVGLLVVPLAWLSAVRIPDWASSDALWTAESSRSGEHWVRGLKLGTVRGIQGRFAAAAAAFREAERLNPASSELLARRIVAELARDGWTTARGRVAARLVTPPRDAAGWLSIAEALADAGAPAAACDAALHARDSLGASGPPLRDRLEGCGEPRPIRP